MSARDGTAVVGRAAELARLDAAVERARGGLPAVVLVTGDPGVGKSHLVGALLGRSDATVVAVACDPAETRIDYGVVERLAAASPLDADTIAGLVAPPGTDPLDAGGALLRFVDETQLADPLVVVVDDAHWADRPSLEALTFAARRLRADRVVLVVTCRLDDVDGLPPGLVRLAEADDGGSRIELSGLDRDAVEALAAGLGRTLPPGAAHRLQAHTGGSPLHVTALLRELPDEALAGAAALPAPKSYARLVLARMAGCSEGARRLMEALVVLGLAAPLATVSEVAGSDDPLSELDEVVRADLARVVDTPGARELRVAHPLVQAAIVEDLAPSRLATLHRAAGDVVAGAPGLAHRIAGAAGRDASLAAEARARSEAEAAAGAYASAARLRLDARLVDPDPGRADADLLGAVDLLLLAGSPADASGHAVAVAALGPGPERDAVLGHLAYVVGPRREAQHHLERAWAALDRPTTADERRLAGRVAALMATVAVDRTDGPSALTWARRARRLAPGLAGDRSLGHMLAMSHALLGQIAEGIGEAGDELARLGPRDHGSRTDLLLGRGVLRMWAGDLTRAAEDLSACLVAGAGGTLVTRETARYSLAELHYRAGRWDAAVVTAEVGASIADAADQAWIGTFPHAVAVFPLAARGEWARAEAHLAAAGRASERAGGGAARLWSGLAAMRLAESRGDHEALAAVGDLFAAGGRPSRDERIVGWRASYAEALATVGRNDDAAGVVAWLASDVRSDATIDVRLDLARAELALARAAGDGSRALRLAETVAADEAVVPSEQFSRARLELAAGGVWREAGEHERAVAVLERARRRFDLLVAAPWRDRTDQELARAGRRPERRAATATPLTPHELAVAHVVAGGCSNREAAAELYLSVKTVEHHLSRVYAKLGVRSRSELPSALAAGPTPA